jgi:hypothetical protein
MQLIVSDVISLLGTGIIALLVSASRRAPDSWRGRAQRTRFGPSLDVRCMSRGQCVRSAMQFFAIGAGALWAIAVLASIGDRVSDQVFDWVPAQAALFALSLFCLMGLVGGIYLLIRAPFRARGGVVPMHPDPESFMRMGGSWEAGLMALIRERYHCTPDTAVQIRMRFLEWQMDAEMVPLEIGPDGRPAMPEDVLKVLDHCAHPEWAEQAARLREEQLRRSNSDARALASKIETEGLTCPHCRQHTYNVRYVKHSRSDTLSYFICRKCGRSFAPADFKPTA